MFHMHCVPHILNLILKSGLEMLDQLIQKIQKAERGIGSSMQRDEKFTHALSQTKIILRGESLQTLTLVGIQLMI